MPQFWEVVGGSSSGGIIVRAGQSAKSAQCDERLTTGSVVEELAVQDGRLQYALAKGDGPTTGWVSLQLKNNDLLKKVEAQDSQEADPKTAAPNRQETVNRQETDPASPKAEDKELLEQIAARCARELARPPLQWKTITTATVTDNCEKVAKGMAYDLEFPWNEETLQKMGPSWLTQAFHKVGSMPEDNKVTKIVLENKIKITTGNNGGKFLFEVEYEKKDPNLHTKLFAKVPFAFSGVTKMDRMSSSVNKQPAELYEINAYRLLESSLPMKTPRFYYGDISNETSNWIIITERIDFHDFDGNNFGRPSPNRPPQLPAFSIEGPYDKCIDHNLRGEPEEYYMLIAKVGAKMAGLAKTGKMGTEESLNLNFRASPDPKNLAMWGMNPGAASGEIPKQVQAKLKNALVFFTGTGKAVFPEWARTDKFGKKFTEVMLKCNAYAAELNFWMHSNHDYTSLAHMNLNVDNAYFWRDQQGTLDCGVFDWGGLGVGSAGTKLWWWFYCMDYDAFKRSIKSLLDCYVDTYKEYSGLQLDSTELYEMVLISAVMQMAGLVSAVPQITRMCPKKEWETIRDRYDPRIGANVDDKSTIRLYLHCMNTIMAIIEEMKAGEILDRWIKNVWVDKFKNTAKTNAMIGLE